MSIFWQFWSIFQQDKKTFQNLFTMTLFWPFRNIFSMTTFWQIMINIFFFLYFYHILTISVNCSQLEMKKKSKPVRMVKNWRNITVFKSRQIQSTIVDCILTIYDHLYIGPADLISLTANVCLGIFNLWYFPSTGYMENICQWSASLENIAICFEIYIGLDRICRLKYQQ